ncbi:hypothetical protein [Wukongibacter sp. M2B1]|uniref:hypothetical protein n=1 Tax=Wukongibacter sp. M2B1 TaxID=3088895 RepID=UPI003D7B3B9F
MLNIKPLHGDFRSCVEDVIVSVASWWERNHELMYAEAWNFQYTPWDPVLPNTIGKRLSEGEDKTWSYLARFHGIFLKYQKNLHSPSEALKLIENELEKGHPVMVYVNDFWCPWRKFYQIEHQIQPCLVVGINVSNSQLICIDPYSTSEFKVFPIDKFMNAYKNCVTFTKGQYTDVDERVEDIIRLSAEKLLECKEHGNRFDNMRIFAFDIEHTLDMNMEMQGSTFSAPRYQLLNTLKYLARRRRQYSLFIGYMSKRYGWNISNYCNEMDLASQKWNIITNLFLKMHYMQEWYISRKNIANKIREAADFEERIANSLLNSLDSYNT